MQVYCIIFRDDSSTVCGSKLCSHQNLLAQLERRIILPLRRSIDRSLKRLEGVKQGQFFLNLKQFEKILFDKEKMSSRQARRLLQSLQESKAGKQIQKDIDEEKQEVQQKKQHGGRFFAMMSESESSESSDDEEATSNSNEGYEEKQKQMEEEKLKKEEEEKKQKKQEEAERLKREERQLKKQQKKKQGNGDDENIKRMLEIVEAGGKNSEDEEEERKVNCDISENSLRQLVGEVELSSTLQILKPKLNYNKEIQRYFKGARLTEKEEEDEEIEHLGLRNKKQARMYLNSKKKSLLKSIRQMILVHDEKPRQPVPERFACEFVGENKLGQKLYTFKPTPRYENLQDTYKMLQDEMDPQVVFDFVSTNPFHTDGLYNLFEYYRLQGKFKEANAMLEQILYIYEDSLGFEFVKIFDDTNNRLALAVEDNKYASTFFAAMLKFIDLLGKKGCYRAALEYNKVLLKLNPESDPAGALLCIDYNALSCKAYDYLIYFIKHFAVELYQNPKYSLQYMPNLIFSASLAKFAKVILPPTVKGKVSEDPSIGPMIDFKEEDFSRAINFSIGHIDESANVMILTSILLYPQLCKSICLANDFHKVAQGHSLLKGWQKKPLKEVLEHSFFSEDSSHPYYAFLGLRNQQDIDGLSKLFEIYVERTKIVWKENKIILWMKAAIGFVLNELERRADFFTYDSLVESLCLESGKNMLPFALNRYRILQKANFSDHVDRFDLHNIQDNVNMEAANEPDVNPNYNPVDTSQGFFRMLASSLLPWVNLPNQNSNSNAVQPGDQLDEQTLREIIAQGGADLLQDPLDDDFEDEEDENQNNY